MYLLAREIGTALERRVNELFGADSPHKEKWKKAYANFTTLTSLALHEEDIKNSKLTSQLELRRYDAEAILISTKNLIKYVQELSRDVAK